MNKEEIVTMIEDISRTCYPKAVRMSPTIIARCDGRYALAIELLRRIGEAEPKLKDNP